MYSVIVKVIGRDSGGSIKDAIISIYEPGSEDSLAGLSTPVYRNNIDAYQVELPGAGDYDLHVQKDGYQDIRQLFSIQRDEIYAENSGNVYVLDASIFELSVDMEPTIVLKRALIYYKNLSAPFQPYPLDSHEIEMKVVLQVLYGNNLSWYSDTEIAFDSMTCLPHWITGSRGPLHEEPFHPDDGFSLEDTPTLNDRNERVHQWPLVWPTPLFRWIELLHKDAVKVGNTSYRNYSYNKNNFLRLNGWGGQLPPLNPGSRRFFSPGTRRFQVGVTLQGVTVFSADEEYSTRISIRDSNTLEGCNDRVTEYLRWLTAFLEVPYEWGGDWFGGKTGNNKGGAPSYDGYGIDCSAFVSCGARFAGFNWTGGYRIGRWKYTTGLLNGISDEIGNGDINPGDILNNSIGGHVVTVFRIVNRTNLNNIQIEIIEASPAGEVRKIERSLQNYYTNRNYTLRRIGLSILSITPNTGTRAGGIPITINGTRFPDDPTVNFGDNELEEIDRRSSTEIRFTLPPGEPGIVPVTVENPDGESFTLENGFTYTEP